MKESLANPVMITISTETYERLGAFVFGHMDHSLATFNRRDGTVTFPVSQERAKRLRQLSRDPDRAIRRMLGDKIS